MAGTYTLIYPSIAYYTISALPSPIAIITISYAFIIVPIPIVKAFLGTLLTLKKSLAASTLVILSK